MEGNRDEAEKCIGIAREALEAGNRDRALRFLGKAQKLYPTETARGEAPSGGGGGGCPGGSRGHAGGRPSAAGRRTAVLMRWGPGAACPARCLCARVRSARCELAPSRREEQDGRSFSVGLSPCCAVIAALESAQPRLTTARLGPRPGLSAAAASEPCANSSQ